MAIKANIAKAVKMLVSDVRNCGFIGRSFGGLQFHRSKGMFGQNRKTLIKSSKCFILFSWRPNILFKNKYVFFSSALEFIVVGPFKYVVKSDYSMVRGISRPPIPHFSYICPSILYV